MQQKNLSPPLEKKQRKKSYTIFALSPEFIKSMQYCYLLVELFFFLTL